VCAHVISCYCHHRRCRHTEFHCIELDLIIVVLVNLITTLVKEAMSLPLSKERGHLGVYCVLTLEKQMVKTQGMVVL
jgi:hypothetical protein